MAIHRLDQIFNPQRIALVGVSPNPNSVGGKVLNNLVGGGFRGVVYPVNPQSEAVMGIQCYSNVESLPKTPDLAVICSAAEEVPGWVERCGEAGILGIIIISAGFRETGSEGRALEDQIAQIMGRFQGMRIIGPNCLGIIAPHNQLNVSFASGLPGKGHIAFISQSGALCTSVLDWAIEGKIGFSHFVSIGNTLDVDFGDLIDFFGEDPNTRSIILYVESITHARKFMSAARAFARAKPILVYKAGRFSESAQVAASHTGAMAAEDAVYDAAFHRMGLARVYDIGEIFNCAELIGRQKIPRGAHLAIVTNAGGPGVMATDALIEANGRLAQLSDETLRALDEVLPPHWSHGNPVDVLGDARSKRIARAVQIVLSDSGADAVLVILTPQAMTNPAATAKAVGELAAQTRKPILAAWLGGGAMREGIRLLTEAGVATYSTPEEAVRAFMILVQYARNLEILYETPKDIMVQFPVDRKKIRKQFETLIPAGDSMNEASSKTLLESYGIPVSRPVHAADEDEAVRAAEKTGYPAVMKIVSPEIIHKTDAGGVILDIRNEEGVRSAYRRMIKSVQSRVPTAVIEGVSLQPMVGEQGVEMILGTKKDPIFGTVIMAGLGGVAAELYQDRVLGFPPLNERLAMNMLKSLKVWPLLKGYRGRPEARIDALVEALIRLSYLAADCPEIGELDINPLLVTPKQVTALDARIILDRDAVDHPGKPFSHLALRPYPEEYVKTGRLSDGSEILLRPIKPEDEPMWFELLGSCSRESIYMRFRYAFHWESHEVASRYCFNDYDREIAIVAETDRKGKRMLLGVGRLVSDPDHESVEYAVLIRDDWQNLGLGSILTDYCMEIAKDWGLKRIVAQTTTDNPRMIAVFKKRGFSVEVDPATSLVEVARNIV